MEKYGTARQAIDGNIILRMRFACWITKATYTHLEYIIGYLLLFHGKNGYANVPQYYVIRRVPVFCLNFVWLESLRQLICSARKIYISDHVCRCSDEVSKNMS